MTKGEDLSVHDDKFLVKQTDTCLVSAGRLMGYGGVVGTALALVAAQNFDAHVSFLQLFGRSVVRIVFPAVLVPGVYGATTCIMDEVRGKDKPLSNGFIGGAAAGAVLGTRSHNPGKIASYALLCGVFGFAARIFATNAIRGESTSDEFNRLHRQVIISDISHLSPNAK